MKKSKDAPNGYMRGGPFGLICLECYRDIRPLGSMSHRAAHHRKRKKNANSAAATRDRS